MKYSDYRNWHCPSCFPRSNSFNPNNNPTRLVLLILSPCYGQGDQGAVRWINRSRNTQPVSGALLSYANSGVLHSRPGIHKTLPRNTPLILLNRLHVRSHLKGEVEASWPEPANTSPQHQETTKGYTKAWSYDIWDPLTWAVLLIPRW